MLAGPGFSAFNFTYDNWGANPGTTLGTSVVPGASNAEGSFTQVASAANISRDVYWVAVQVVAANTAAASKQHLLDIGVDEAGGTSYTARISNIVCHSAAPFASSFGGFTFLFPLYIKSGSTVAVRIQGSNATAGTVLVLCKFYGDPTSPENNPIGQYSETIGTITASGGVAFTPGNAADGAWVSLGTTTVDLWWWQLAASINNATVNARQTYVDLAYGDATNKVIIQRNMIMTATSEEAAEVMRANTIWLNCYKFVPAGSTMYVRGRSSAAPDTGWNAVAVGMGG